MAETIDTLRAGREFVAIVRPVSGLRQRYLSVDCVGVASLHCAVSALRTPLFDRAARK